LNISEIFPGSAQQFTSGVVLSNISLRMKNCYLLICFFCLCISGTATAQGTGLLTGTVADAINRMPLPGATVSLNGDSRKTSTDSLGRFRFRDLKAGSYSITVSYIGYQAESRYNIPVSAGNENEINFLLQRNTVTGTEVIVKAGRKTARAATLESPLSVQRLTAEEIKANPGGNFDISRVVNTLPGVGGSAGIIGGYRNDIIVRGGGPGENVFYLDGIEIPVINHFATQGSGGGPTGILNVSFLEDVKLSSGAFDAKYDNALSSVFAFRQKTGSTDRTQGNVRLSGTELAGTLEGPMNKKGNLTYLASVRRSYLQLLFSAIDLPIRPNYWDFQYKLTYKPDAKSTLTFIGIGAIDEFGFGTVKKPTQDKLYTLFQVPSITQNSYAAGLSYQRTLQNGYLQLALSRNHLDNAIQKYDNNDASIATNLRYRNTATENENKLRLEVNQFVNNWKLSYGGVLQYLQYNTFSNIRRRAALGTQPEDRLLFAGDISFFRYGAFVQAGRKLFNNRLGVNMGIRSDMNSFTANGNDISKAFSPRIALSYAVTDQWTLNAAAGRYARIAPYTVLGFRDNNGNLVNKNNDYITNVQYTIGVEYLPQSTTRFTLEGFYKKYGSVPVTVKDGISINNLGADFGTVGNEAVTPTGTGESMGLEFFAQRKLTKRFFGLFSYTFFYSRFSNRDGSLKPSAWDTRHLVSTTIGYKFNRNWELGLKYRLQGGAPYTPFDMTASRLNYLTLGQGILDYKQFNAQRLGSFSSSDIRIDKKYYFKRMTLDLYLDVTNWLRAKSVAYPEYSFERNLTTSAFVTTDGLPVKTNGSNAVPLILRNEDPVFVPTIGFIIEF
jgi:hypothetical protein